LINDHLPGHSPEIVKTGKQVINDFFVIKGMVLESDVAITTGRKQGSEDEKPETTLAGGTGQNQAASVSRRAIPEPWYRS